MPSITSMIPAYALTRAERLSKTYKGICISLVVKHTTQNKTTAQGYTHAAAQKTQAWSPVQERAICLGL